MGVSFSVVLLYKDGSCLSRKKILTKKDRMLEATCVEVLENSQNVNAAQGGMEMG